jgi:hypothetical protein
MKLNVMAGQDDFINHSMISSWNRCRHAWHIAFERGIVPRFDRPPIQIGTAVHGGLAAVLAGLSASPLLGVEQWSAKVREVELTDEEEAAVKQTEALAYGICVRTLKQLDVGHRWETVRLDGKPLVEYQFFHKFKRRIGPFRFFRGTVDWVARELEHGAVWLIDHKCYSTFQPVENEETNLQMAVYQFLISQKGVEPCGSLCHQIRPELPKQPKRNKDGSMSRAECMTDWPTYQAALLDAGLIEEDYSEMKDKLDKREWWRYSKAYRTMAEVRALWETTIMPGVKEIASKRKRIFRAMNPMNCGRCFTRDLCLEELRGGDVDFLLRTKYKHKDDPSAPFIPVLVPEEEA